MTTKPTTCYFCNKQTDAEAFCHGCSHTVCFDCDLGTGLFGPHDVHEHQPDEDDE